MSFSIYISHLGIIVLIRKIASHVISKDHPSFGLWTGLGIFMLSIVLTYYVSSLTYTFIEIKLSSKLRNWLLSHMLATSVVVKQQVG